jgi:hypothetical protein
MKILVATKKGQGLRKNDFSWAEEGELVNFGSECDGESVDGGCGCRRSLSGLKTHKATTTVLVVDKKMTTKKLAEEILKSLVAGGWYDSPKNEQAKKHAEEDAQELSRIANFFRVGAVLERRGQGTRERIVNP